MFYNPAVKENPIHCLIERTMLRENDSPCQSPRTGLRFSHESWPCSPARSSVAQGCSHRSLPGCTGDPPASRGPSHAPSFEPWPSKQSLYAWSDLSPLLGNCCSLGQREPESLSASLSEVRLLIMAWHHSLVHPIYCS